MTAELDAPAASTQMRRISGRNLYAQVGSTGEASDGFAAPKCWAPTSANEKAGPKRAGLRQTRAVQAVAQRIRMLLPIAAPRAMRPAAAASATTGETWIDFFHHGSAICGTSAGSAAMICALT